ncbi:MAG: hypothetical protein ACFE7R_00030 [Candidatus Hodarchaeota archaeon]
MTGDSDFTNDEDDTTAYPEINETEIMKEEYRASSRKHTKRGVILLLSPILIFIVLFLAPADLADNIAIGTIVSTMVLAIVGMIILVIYGLGPTILLRGFDILARVSPPEPILIKRYAIVKVNDVYLLAHGLSGHIYVVAFRGTPQIELGNKTKLPRALYRWESKIDIDGVKLVRREGTFSIPISQDEYVSGEAVLYGAQYQPSRYNWNIPEFSRAQLLAIVEHITEDANRQY